MSSTSNPPAAVPRGGLARLVETLVSRAGSLPPPTTDFTVTRNVRIPTRDGTRLAADLYLAGEPTAGTLLVVGPYGRAYPMALPLVRVFAARGYHAVFVSCRGTFGSEGTFDPMRTDAADGRDIADWLIGQPWFTGSFATLGMSYLGFTQWALLTDPPPELATAVISVGPHDFSRHVWGTGAFRLDFLGWSDGIVHQADRSVPRTLLRRATNGRRMKAIVDQLPLADAGESFLQGRGPWYREWVTRPDLTDPYWDPTDNGVALDRAQVPVLLIGGWQDLFLDETMEQYRRLQARNCDVALTVGPWSHVQVGFSPLAIRETLQWLEQHLAGRARQARSSPVHVHMTGASRWHHLPSWPPPGQSRAWYLHPDGDLRPAQPDLDATSSSFIFDPAHPTPTLGGPLLSGRCRVDDSPLAGRPDVLAFTSSPLDGDLDVAGTPTVELVHESDTPYADLFARLSEVDAAGRSHNLAEGYRRLDPGRAGNEVTLPLRDLFHRFRSGSSIRVLIAGGSHPHYARNLGTEENPGLATSMRAARHTVFHGRGGSSRLVLPVTIDGRRTRTADP
jgi:putative CocE/NonD family hydrolase